METFRNTEKVVEERHDWDRWQWNGSGITEGTLHELAYAATIHNLLPAEYSAFSGALHAKVAGPGVALRQADPHALTRDFALNLMGSPREDV